MSYREFNLEKAKNDFNLTISESTNLFAHLPNLPCSQLLKETLEYNLPLALASNSEKARSELIIAPILVDLRRQLKEKISLFSGVDFSVDPAQGLNGICDFLITQSTEILMINSPVIIIVEAKKENIVAGLGQCVAEMVAARIFNERSGNNIKTILGSVTTGSIWQFLQLEQDLIKVDLSEYYLKDVEQILGILAGIIRD